MSTFNTAEWRKILDLANSSAELFGLPKRRSKSVVLGTFNIRKLGAVKKRTPKAWEFLEFIANRFDLLAIQEVMDDLSGIRHLHKLLGPKYGLVVSDVTGVYPGDRGNAERLALLFHWPRVARTELASDISYDRSKVVNTLFDYHQDFQQSWEQHTYDLGKWEAKKDYHRQQGKKSPPAPRIVLPRFLTFIRQPHCVSIQVLAKNDVKPYDLLLVNAHLLYGQNKNERRWEFESLIEWLTIRAKQSSRMYHKNILLMGDCNLEFEAIGVKREAINAKLKTLNKTVLKSKRAAKVNFPLLTPHPKHGELKTNLRLDETYDQIALFNHDQRLPAAEENEQAGQNGVNGYDYGVFSITDLIAQALHGKPFAELLASERKTIIKKAEFDISDHMPAWIRLPIPGA